MTLARCIRASPVAGQLGHGIAGMQLIADMSGADIRGISAPCLTQMKHPDARLTRPRCFRATGKNIGPARTP